MKIIVNPHNVEIVREETEPINEKEVNVSKCTFEFSEEITREFTKWAYFTLNGETYKQLIQDNECDYPSEVLEQEGTLEIGITAEKVVNGNKIFFNPSPDYYDTWVGSLKDAENGSQPTPSELEQLEQAILNNANDISDIQTKLDTIEEGAEVNIIEEVQVNGTPLEVVDKSVNVPVPTKTSDITNDSGFIDNNVDDLINYTLTTETGSKIDLSIDIYSYVLTATLKDKNNNAISSSNIDLPLETMVVNARYDSDTKEIVLVLKNGQEVRFSVADLVSGLQTEITENNKLASDLVDDTNQTHKFTSTSEKNTWNAKYDKPSNGIPKTDLANSVQESLGKADTAIQDVSDKEDKSNKVTSISSSSTDTQYPSAKCVYDSQEEQNEEIDRLKMIYNILPTTSDEDDEIELNDTGEMTFKHIDLKGNTSQAVIPEEQGTSVSNTSINVSDVNTSKEHTIEMSGNTYQETTTGKNKLPYPSNFNTTINTITFTGTDGAYSVKGGSGSATLSSQQVPYNYTIASGDYLHMMNSVVDANVGMQLYFSDNTSASPSFSSQNRIFDLSSRVGKTIVGIGLSTTSSYTGTEIKATPMIVNSSTATDYEPFTNGASPNPSYPQPIEVVTGTNNITIANGDNTQITTYPINLGNIELCKINTYQDRIYKSNDKWYLEKNINKVIYDGSNDENWSQMVQQGDYYRYGIKYTNIKNDSTLETTILNYSNYFRAITFFNRNADINNTIYTICNNNVSNSAFYINTSMFTSLSDFKTWLSTHNTIVYYVLATPTTTEITDSTLVSQLNALYNSTLYSTTNINTTTSNLLPYIDLHYNFVTPSPSPSRPSVVNVVKGNNTIKIEGLNLFKDEYIGIPDADNINAVLSTGTYTLSACDNTNFGTNIYVRLFDKNGNIITESEHMTATSGGSTINWNFSNSSYSYYGGSNFSTITFTIDNDYQLNIGLLNSSGTRKVMLVKGSEVVRTYTPYQSQTYPINIGNMELCKIGTYQDYFYKDNGNWYKKNNIAKVIFDGSDDENWTINTSSGYYRASFYLQSIYEYTDSGRYIDKILCSNFYLSITDAIGIIFQFKRNLLYYVPNGITTVEGWRTWLSSNNSTVYYVLNTPTDTQITDTTLINQLNNLEKAYSYDTQTNISQTNTDKPFIIYAEAIRSLKDVFE